MDVSSVHVRSGLHALSGMDDCIVRTLAVLAVPFVCLTAIRGGSSFISHGPGGQGALHGGGSMLHVCSPVADMRRIVGRHLVVWCHRSDAYAAEPEELVLVDGVCGIG